MCEDGQILKGPAFPTEGWGFESQNKFYHSILQWSVQACAQCGVTWESEYGHTLKGDVELSVRQMTVQFIIA